MFSILDGNLERMTVEYKLGTERDALILALFWNKIEDKPYYIENKNGDFIALIYGGVVWLPSPDEAIHPVITC